MKIENYINSNDRLIIFCSGWASDPVLFRGLSADDMDMIFIYDYTGLSKIKDINGYIDIRDILKNHSESYLVCWSFGAAAGHLLFREYRELFNKSIAVNGTALPVDRQYGIHPRIFRRTADILTSDTCRLFLENMLCDEKARKYYEEHRPLRTFVSVKDELTELGRVFDNTDIHYDSGFFTDIIISRNDRIFKPEVQEAFARDHGIQGISYLDAPHFPFYLFDTWKGIII